MTVKIDMEMPKSCYRCRFCDADNDLLLAYCYAKFNHPFPIKLTEDISELKERQGWCPLQEVKE